MAHICRERNTSWLDSHRRWSRERGPVKVTSVSLTFESGVTGQSVTFSATADNEDDDGETVTIGFDTLPAGVTEAGSGSETVVTIARSVAEVAPPPAMSSSREP